jgi:parvulin-like peptidyl-prolyl isomerase
MKRLIFFAVFVSFLMVSAFAQQFNLQPVAIVNLIRSEPISVGQLRTEVERFEAAAGRTLSVDERRQVLDTVINEKLVLQAAERDRIVVTDNEINQYFSELRSQLAQNIGHQPSEAEFAQAVRNESGMDVASFRTMLRTQMILQKYLSAKKGDLLNSYKVPTEQDIAAKYNLSRTELVRPETVRLSVIQIPFGSDAAARTRARELGDRLIRDIGSDPSKFDEVAMRGAAANSGYSAGDAAYLPRNEAALSSVGQNLMNAAFSLRQGQVSSLIEGLDGFYIIKVTANYALKNLELDDIYQLGTNVTVRNLIGQSLLNERQQAVLNQATNEIITELRAGGRSFQIVESNLNW